MSHEEVFKINGVYYAVEWEMEGDNPIWILADDDTCNGPNLDKMTQDLIGQAIWAYMADWWSGMDDYL